MARSEVVKDGGEWGKLRDDEALTLLEAYGIPTPQYSLAYDEDSAVEAADRIGYPVVAKIVSRSVIHKTDVGGVVLGLNNPHDVREAFRKLSRISGFEGVLIQKMVDKGVELIVGATYDEIFGHVILFGLGGIFTELYRDISMRVTPLERRDILEMIREVKAYRILAGYRGLPPRDINAIVDIIYKFSKLVVENEIGEADLNPVVALEKGAYVVDARFILRRGRRA